VAVIGRATRIAPESLNRMSGRRADQATKIVLIPEHGRGGRVAVGGRIDRATKTVLIPERGRTDRAAVGGRIDRATKTVLIPERGRADRAAVGGRAMRIDPESLDRLSGRRAGLASGRAAETAPESIDRAEGRYPTGRRSTFSDRPFGRQWVG
jgi:hypothetical protein